MLLDLYLGVVIAQVKGKDQQAAYRLIQKAKKRCDLTQVVKCDSRSLRALGQRPA